MSDEIIEAQRETIEAKNALIADLKAHIVELRAKLIESRPLRVRYDAETRVLEASRALPESTLAFWRATRHIQGFDPAIEFIDAVVALRAFEEKQR